MTKNKLFQELEKAISDAYTEGVTLDQAEKLAAKALSAQVALSEQLASADLHARMSKSGLKAIKAAVYMNTVSAADKKPTEAMISSIVDSDEHVAQSQDQLDKAEVERDELNRLYDIFHEAHVYFRGVAKGRFEA